MSDGEPVIRALDDSTIDRIAAGEVVERPASVVKELVENALDADAAVIDVDVDAGGTDRIRVADDGVGMSERSLERAVQRHTTSKILDINDLETGVETLGFRGEALHTIGAVSRMSISSKPRGSESGTKLTLVGGSIESIEPVGCPPGTAVEVTDLFYNTPARRKFLKREATEFDHINRIVTQYALANPDIAVTLSHDDRHVFGTTGIGDLRGAVLAVYGRDVATSMIDVTGESTGPIQSITGLISDPETTRSNASYCSTFVNGRAIRSTVLRDAILDAYGTQLGPGRYPFAVLHLTVVPDSIDVNVHPRKTAIRFDDDQAVKRNMTSVLRDTLRDHGHVRRSAPKGRSAPAETPIIPEGAAADEDDGQAGESIGRSRPPIDKSRQKSRYSGQIESRRWLRDTGVQQQFESDEDDLEFDRLPPLTVVGQIRDTFVLAESADGLLMVDQHAADERVNYERLRTAFENDTNVQTLVEPVHLELTAGEAATFDAFEEPLRHLGFAASRSGSVVEIATVPTVIGEVLDPELLHDVLAGFISGDPLETVDATADALLADLACHPAVTGNTSLTDGSVISLIKSLDACDNPYECPHGRPVVIQVPWTEIEDRFERDYPGHE